MSKEHDIMITLKNDEWLDSPNVVVEQLRAVKSESVTIDASASEPLGAQIAQMILSAKKTASLNNGDLKFKNASDEFTRSLDVLGLTSAFEELKI